MVLAESALWSFVIIESVLRHLPRLSMTQAIRFEKPVRNSAYRRPSGKFEKPKCPHESTFQ